MIHKSLGEAFKFEFLIFSNIYLTYLRNLKIIIPVVKPNELHAFLKAPVTSNWARLQFRFKWSRWWLDWNNISKCLTWIFSNHLYCSFNSFLPYLKFWPLWFWYENKRGRNNAFFHLGWTKFKGDGIKLELLIKQKKACKTFDWRLDIKWHGWNPEQRVDTVQHAYTFLYNKPVYKKLDLQRPKNKTLTSTSKI